MPALPSTVDVGDSSNEPVRGPEIPELYTNFDKHIAYHIVNGGPERSERGSEFRIRNHTGTLKGWVPFITEVVQRCGLMSVVQASYNTVDDHLLRAFIERWQPATNTFHLPVGEMTITLDDVSTLVGLPVVGRTVSCERLIRDSKTKPSSLMFELLGEYPDDVNKKKAVKLEWLKAKFSKVTMRDSAEKRTYAIRAYLLFFLRCTILCDKTGNMVRVEYLNLVSNLDRIGEYAWGTACLCRLYDELSSASQKSTNSMAGWLTLFQSWIYEHFPYLAGGTLKTEFEGPLASRWEPQLKTTSTPERASYLRSRLDDLITDQVLWSPYTAIRDRFPMPDSAWFSGMICCMDHFEAYHPDRVMRQFNRVQIIPGRAYMSKDM
ncbi:PREDICTED: serine/threonine-protein phosphatase 7 long form homolog [Erythranthe guttata]|uniref:serine/threonine-protein phosphatase 7 long form homolog n=1 Tax=Erythranthe guttata TaxID=4155 RepID=UPI00064DAB77|nr:PREDICTED: serine/threonine-protein phosphatase 7 long form homolog [Erythranthe guttata]|eukprot:XP_012838655.1 PREDICTED: serine/threonine-protein phosphatase 7 long form homolog [Erythranthe guttata]